MQKNKLWNIHLIINLLYFLILLLNQCYAEKTTEADDPILKYKAHPNFIEFSVNTTLYELINVTCNSIVDTPTPVLFEEPNKCKNLISCTKYRAYAHIKNKTAESEQNEIFQLEITPTTEYSEPKVHIEIEELEVFPHIINLPWQVTEHPNCVGKFRIIVTSDDKDNKIDVIAEKRNDPKYIYKFDGLSPCRAYEIELIVFDTNNTEIKPSKYANATTKYDDPGTVESLEFANITNKADSVKATWTVPKYTTCIDYYLFKWIRKSCVEKGSSGNFLEKCTWDTINITNSKQTEQMIGNLEGCETYMVQILTNGKKTQNNIKTGYFISDEQVPGEIDNVEASNVSPTKLLLSWSKPKLNPKCVKNFIIKISGAIQEKLPSTNLTFTQPETYLIIAKDLKPCGTYNFTFYSKSFTDHRSKSRLFQFSMNPDSPSEITNIKPKRLYPTEFVLTWDDPLYGELCVDEYRTNGWSEKYPNNPDYRFEANVKENVLIRKELISCMDYVVQIIPVVRRTPAIDGKLLQYKVSMLPQRKLQPKFLETASKTYNSIKVEVADQDEKNVCPILYVRFQCKATTNATIMYAEKVNQAFNNKYEAVISPLSPFTTYNCEADFFNIDGWSDNSNTNSFTTDIYYPEEPIFHQYQVTKNSIVIEWLKPLYTNGMVIVYKVYLKQMEPKYKIYPHCLINKYNPKQIEVSKTEYNFTYLLPYYQYSAQIAATNDFGIGLFSEPVYITTDPDVSNPVEDFGVSDINLETNDTDYKANITFKWKVPCQTNGDVAYYLIKFNGVRPDFTDHVFEVKLNKLFVTNDGYIFYSKYDFKPEFHYTAAISVAIDQIDGVSLESQIKFVSPAGIPKRYNDTESKEIVQVNAFESNNPTTSALVKISSTAMRSEMGKIEYAAILLSELDCQESPQLKSGVFNVDKEWPNILTWYDAYKNSCILQYQTTPERWQPFTSTSNKSSKSLDNIEFVIGEQSNCHGEGLYCNGPLKFNTNYKMVLRIFTRNGFCDVLAVEFKTDELIRWHLIIIIMTTILLLAFFLGLIYLWINKKRLWYKQSQSGNIEDQSGDVSIKNFIVYYCEIAKKDKLQREFKELAVVENDANLCSYVTRYNEKKNRYSNIFPYEKNRVILDNDADGSDYINASFISGYKRKKEYIATQGPKPETFIDFWKMVLQYNVKVVIMLTQFREGDAIKCHQYYPMIPFKEMKFGKNISVTCKKETFTDLYEKRDMIVKHIDDEITHNVVHYFFKKWPDHDTPTDPHDLITFIKKIKSDKSKRSPIIVHCSAGVGRAGTFIGLDIIIQRIKKEAKINIYETVKELRFQRMKMVQNIQQYQFLYRCTKESIQQKCRKDKKETSDSQSIILNNNNNKSNGTSQNSLRTNESCQSFSPNDIESVM